MMRRRQVLVTLAVLSVAIVLAGCSHTEQLKAAAVPTLPQPTPVGMNQLPPEPRCPWRTAAATAT